MEARKGGRGRRIAVNLAVLACAVILVTGFAEAVLHATGMAPEPSLFTVTEKQFRRVPGLYSPNQRVIVNPGTAFAHTVTIDSLGYRGPDVPRAKSPDELRVLFAGDSFTWGHNVEDGETLPAQLERVLGERCGSVRVINAGISGSTILEQRHMVERGLVLEPDVVVVMYHENDIGELVHTRLWDQLAGNRHAKSRFPLGLIYPVVHETALWNLALRVTHSYRIQAGLQGMERHANEQAATDAARAEYRTLLGVVADTLARRRIPFVFAAFPHPESLEAGRAADDYYMALDRARALHVPVVDLMDALRASGTAVDGLYLLPDDYHPSPAGHAVAARMLADTVVAAARAECR